MEHYVEDTSDIYWVATDLTSHHTNREGADEIK